MTADEALKQLQDSALGLLAGLDRAPKSLRIKTDQVELHVEWPEPVEGAVAVAPVAAAAPAAAAPVVVPADNLEYLTSQMVGVFYRAPEPGAKPFVEPGDLITPGQQVGIIEAMKLMIPVEADGVGRVTDVLVGDGTSVEYGDKLFAFEPSNA